MIMTRRSFTFAMTATTAALMAGTSKAEVEKAVITDLQSAFNGESNASAKYAMYAQKAKEAGYASVSALFSAASFAEKIHAQKHANVLTFYKAEAKSEIKLPQWVDVKTALQDAIKGETYEFTEMYPGFIKTAEDKKISAAVRSFSTAMKTEVVHAEYYKTALDNLESWKAAGKTSYICNVCGFTTNDASLETCPYCSAPKDKFTTFK
ncbi:MAG: rubrerythrin family protein [bacterium]